MGNFNGVPYPIQKTPLGYFYPQSGAAQIKSDLLCLLLTNPGERCLSGDTKISLTNGTEVPIQELVGQEPFLVYSYDTNLNSIVHGQATAHETLQNASLVEVELDNKEIVHCTPDHLWLMLDGTYRSAEQLCTGDSLMPLCKVTSVIALEYKKDCYDLHVEQYNNFAVSAGAFVHNCMQPSYGTPLRTLIFEPNDATLQATATQMITNAIAMWEPRIAINQIQVLTTPDAPLLNPSDNGSQINNILMIVISFYDPGDIQVIQTLTLEVPLNAGSIS